MKNLMLALVVISLTGCVCGPDYLAMKPGHPFHKKDVPMRCEMIGKRGLR